MSIPAYWTRTSRKPVIVAGYEFLSYRVAVNSYTLWCDTLQARVMRTYNRKLTDAGRIRLEAYEAKHGRVGP